MKFSTNGYGRKNGYRFELKYGAYLDGKTAAKPWYLFIAGPNAQTYTERTHRFSTQEEAAEFCEQVAAGKIKVTDIQAEESNSLREYMSKQHSAAKNEFEDFVTTARTLGVTPAILPDLLRAYSKLSMEARLFITEEHLSELSQPEAEPNLKFCDFLNKFYCEDIDVTLIDSEAREHPQPAVVYLSPTDLKKGYDYEPYEKWLLTLPIDQISNEDGIIKIRVTTDFNSNQVCFLLDESGFTSTKWLDYTQRAEWAGADFDSRLAFLQSGKSFETPFNGEIMDAAHPKLRMELCELLADNNTVLIATYPDNEEDYYAYTLVKNPETGMMDFGNLMEEIPIIHTDPGKGLTSSLDGKVYWAQHVANKARAEALGRAPLMKPTEREI